MRSPISPIFAEFFMQKLEETLIPTLNLSLYAWWRYVDDVFTIAKIKDIDKIKTTLNSFHPAIKFTHEIMENNRIAFLDTQLTIKDSFTFGFSIYRKKTHSDRYLNFSSNHPLHHKISVIDSLVTRAQRICDSENLQGELEHIRDALVRNGYPKRMIESRVDYHKTRSHSSIPNQRDDMTKRIVLPYTGRVTTEIAHIIKSQTNLEVAFRPSYQQAIHFSH